MHLDVPQVRILPVKGDPKSLLELPQAELDAVRAAILRPLGHTFRAPNRVALYLFADGSWVIENFQRRGRQRGTGRHDTDGLATRLAAALETIACGGHGRRLRGTGWSMTCRKCWTA